jgi:hypothetical protein
MIVHCSTKSGHTQQIRGILFCKGWTLLVKLDLHLGGEAGRQRDTTTPTCKGLTKPVSTLPRPTNWSPRCAEEKCTSMYCTTVSLVLHPSHVKNVQPSIQSCCLTSATRYILSLAAFSDVKDQWERNPFNILVGNSGTSSCCQPLAYNSILYTAGTVQVCEQQKGLVHTELSPASK